MHRWRVNDCAQLAVAGLERAQRLGVEGLLSAACCVWPVLVSVARCAMEPSTLLANSSHPSPKRW